MSDARLLEKQGGKPVDVYTDVNTSDCTAALGSESRATTGRTDVLTDAWTDGLTDAWTDGLTDAWTDGLTDIGVLEASVGSGESVALASSDLIDNEFWSPDKVELTIHLQAPPLSGSNDAPLSSNKDAADAVKNAVEKKIQMKKKKRS